MNSKTRARVIILPMESCNSIFGHAHLRIFRFLIKLTFGTLRAGQPSTFLTQTLEIGLDRTTYKNFARSGGAKTEFAQVSMYMYYYHELEKTNTTILYQPLNVI